MLFIGFSARPDLPGEDKEALVEEEVGTNGLSPLIKCPDLSSSFFFFFFFFLEQFMSYWFTLFCCFLGGGRKHGIISLD